MNEHSVSVQRATFTTTALIYALMPDIFCELTVQDFTLTELCRCRLMRRTVWKCGNYMGGLLWIRSPPFIKPLENCGWNVKNMHDTIRK